MSLHNQSGFGSPNVEALPLETGAEGVRTISAFNDAARAIADGYDISHGYAVDPQGPSVATEAPTLDASEVDARIAAGRRGLALARSVLENAGTLSDRQGHDIDPIAAMRRVGIRSRLEPARAVLARAGRVHTNTQ